MTAPIIFQTSAAVGGGGAWAYAGAEPSRANVANTPAAAMADLAREAGRTTSASSYIIISLLLSAKWFCQCDVTAAPGVRRRRRDAFSYNPRLPRLSMCSAHIRRGRP